MSQFYTDPSRETDEHALPDAEVFFSTGTTPDATWTWGLDRGFYWWPCFPGCLPGGEPVGPFETKDEAVRDARGDD
jgi:hypothetical protein